MATENSLVNGWKLFIDALKLLLKRPVFIVPIFIAWIITSAIVLYIRYYFAFPESVGAGFTVLLLIFFAVALTIIFSNLMMLELMEQIESGQRASLLRAFGHALSLDLIKAIPVALLWAVIWMITSILKAMRSKSKSRSRRPSPSMSDVGKTLGGANAGPLTWYKLRLTFFEKLLRMYIFLTLPAIAWENKGTLAAFKRSRDIIKKHAAEFLTGYTLTIIMTLFLGIPAVIFFYTAAEITVGPFAWALFIIYTGCTWSLGIYMEQMTVSMLYLWHMKWERHGAKGELKDVPRPSLLDEIPEFTHRNQQRPRS